MSLSSHTLKPARGSKTRRVRIGRGNGSGLGTTAGRGTKGQRARTGGRNKLKLKGIKQMLLRIPKNRGFHSGIAHPVAVTLTQLERWCQAGERVTLAALQRRNLVPAGAIGVKVVSTGTLSKKLILIGMTASKTAKEAVEKAGGSFEAESAIAGKKRAKKPGKK